MKFIYVSTGLTTLALGLVGSIAYFNQVATPVEGILRSPNYLPEVQESSPVIWHDKVVLVESVHNQRNGIGINIKTIQGALIRYIPWPYGFASATNEQGQIIIHGNSGVSTHGNSIRRMVLDGDTLAQLNDATVYQAKTDETIYNTSYAAGILAVETSTGNGRFKTRFLTTTQDPYQDIGQTFDDDGYAACPTVKYINGMMYVFYMTTKKLAHPIGNLEYGFETRVVRTKDFVNFEAARHIMLRPDLADGINASDIDLVEHDHKVYINYIYGDQIGLNGNRIAYFYGTMEDLAKALWK